MERKFYEILRENGIFGEDVNAVLYAVSEMLEYAADETKRKEPYAIHTIDDLRSAKNSVQDLVWMMRE